MGKRGAKHYAGPKVKAARKLVRCLGLGTDHYFWSSNPVYHRVCERCAQRIENARVSPMAEEPVRTGVP